MQERSVKKSISFRLFTATLAVATMITAALSLFSVLSRQALLRQASANNQVYTELLVEQMDHSLMELRQYIENIYYMNEYYRRLCRSSDPSDRYLLAQEINRNVEDYLPLHQYGILFYITAPNFQCPTVSTFQRGTDILPVSDYLKKLRSQDQNSGTDKGNKEQSVVPEGYRTIHFGGKPYLIIRYKKEDVEIGAFVDADEFLATVRYAESIGYTTFSLREKEGTVISDFSATLSGKGRSLYSECPMTECPLILCTAASESTFLNKIGFLQIMIIGMTVLALISFLLYFIFQQWKIYRPLRELRVTLKKISDGNLETRLDSENPTRELSEIYHTINTYIDHVTDFRTQTYLERLNRQNIEMQFLQLQLRPHFFLNSLKGIYALAESRNYEEIQEYVLCLSNHFRFLLYDTTKLIELRKELMHTQNYMRMQRIGLQKGDIHCNLNVRGVNENSLVPPLILQTFMENSIKYAIIPDRPLTMEIQIHQTGEESEGEKLVFSFKDNGPGFKDEILDEIQQNEEEFFRQHKGYGNLKRRLDLIYPGQSEIYLYNHPSGGAAVEVLIPAGKSEA